MNNNIPKNYKECGTKIIQVYGEELEDKIYRANEDYETNFNYVNDALEFNDKVIGKRKTMDLEIAKLVAKYDIQKLYTDNPPIFYSITKSLIVLKFDTNTSKYELIKLYDEISSSDTIRIWQIKYDNEKPIHLCAEIVCKSGESYSFGFYFEGNEPITGLFSSKPLVLVTPDFLLNNHISRQINNLKDGGTLEFAKMIHESIIGEESFRRLKNLFDSIFDEKDMDINNKKKKKNPIVEVAMNSSKLQYTDSTGQFLNFNEKIKKMEPTSYGTVNTVLWKKIESLIRTLNSIKEKKRTESKLSNTKTTHILFYYLSYEVKVEKFNDEQCVYRKASGKVPRGLKRFSNIVKRKSSKSPIGINCTSSLDILFKDLIDCSTESFVAAPFFCKSKRKLEECSVKHKHTKTNKNNKNNNGKSRNSSKKRNNNPNPNPTPNPNPNPNSNPNPNTNPNTNPNLNPKLVLDLDLGLKLDNLDLALDPEEFFLNPRQSSA